MRGINRRNDGTTMDLVLKIVPAVFTFVACIFMAVAVCSGVKSKSDSNSMEGLSIINFNMSTFGKNVVSSINVSDKGKEGCGNVGDFVDKTSQQVTDTVDGAKDKVTDTVDDVTSTLGGILVRGSAGDAVEDVCNTVVDGVQKGLDGLVDAVNKLAGNVAEAIGIQDYYSVHIGSLCYGSYEPDFKDKNAKVKIEKCTDKFDQDQTDMSKLLDTEMDAGPFELDLSKIELVKDIQEGLDKIPKVLGLMARATLLPVVIMFFGWLCCLGVLATEYCMYRMQKLMLFSAIGCLGLAWFMWLILAAVLTGVAETIKKAVAKHGEKFGIYASTSPGLYFLIWASVVLVAIVIGLLVFLLIRVRQYEKRKQQLGGAAGDKNASTSTMQDSHGYVQMEVEGGARFKEEKI